MPTIIEISDISSPALDVFARLTEAQLRSRLEPKKGVFIAESPTVIRLALDAGVEPLSLLVERGQLTGSAREMLDRCGDIPLYTADSELLAGLTGYALSQGVLGAMRRPRPLRAEELCVNARRVAVLENIADSTNMGAIMRSAAALGIEAVLLSPSCCDPLLRRAVRVSMGTVFQVPWARIGTDAARWAQPGMDMLRGQGFTTIAMALRDDAVPLDDPRLLTERLAIVLGAEGHGLSPTTIAACDTIARIPMSHGVDSLNVAAAGTVAFWQLRPPACPLAQNMIE
jgi:tRNA G18 (ribose-2'-O)-methylase SpoU